MSEIDRSSGDLSPEQEELLAVLLEREGRGPPPLSSTQRRLFTGGRLAEGTSLGNVPFAFRIAGRLDVPVLIRSLNEIARRHDVLRTTFREVDGLAMPIIASSIDISVPVVDLRPLESAKRDGEALRRVEEEAHRAFDVGQGPLLRGQVIRLADEEWVLVLVAHHLLTDGWGVRLLLHELGALYRSALAGDPPRLPDLPAQYTDYARWESQWLRSEAVTSHLEYWRAQLAGARVTELPLDSPRPRSPSWASVTEPFALSPELSDALRGLSRQEGVTLYTVLLTAFQTLLQRYSLQSDVLLGTIISRRHRSELEALIGNFGSSLLLRTDFSRDPTLRELLHRVNDVVLDAFAHSDVPLEALFATGAADTPLRPLPPFQVMFILRDTPLAKDLDLGSPVLQSIHVGAGASSLDLILDITDGAPGLTGHLEYKRDLFAVTSAVRIMSEYRDLLHRMVTQPHQRLCQLPVLRGTGAPAGAAQAAPQRASPVAPGTPTERFIASLWQQALGVQTVGVHDNFFDLGGHSLLGMAVIDRIERETTCRLTVVDLGLQNLGQLARRCDQRRASRHGTAGITGRLLRAVRGALGRS